MPIKSTVEYKVFNPLTNEWMLKSEEFKSKAAASRWIAFNKRESLFSWVVKDIKEV